MKHIILFTFLILAVAKIHCQDEFADICGPNARFVSCKSCCEEETCENRNPSSCEICPAVCTGGGCECLPGYIRKTKNGPCVESC
ncbi:chymotrypsin/elastase isoinhibitor 1 isoform X2 [Diabrotica virgifera virgifera]|uniref:TIL domain-containing protein n=1 Tax=Diabrotica virgifera virgifera TaxID=50390 RepID=A0ABM5IIE2_DIAVI|nr:chymotrypsin/elastase isoinhibitor 1 isoform X2 [Diabrotica virgifera virgifera]